MSHILFLSLLLSPAQAEDLTLTRVALASPAADTALADGAACLDQEAVRLAAGDPGARLWLTEGVWNAVLGDADHDGLFDAPAGLDALAWAPGAADFRLLDLWFSSDGDFQGWKDGDVLRLNAAGAVELVHAEDDIRSALGTASALDLDALEVDAQQRVWFSLRDGVTSSFLGAVEDGDVLIYDPALGTVVRHATEAEVQAWVDHADPAAGAAGDLKSLAFDPLDGALLFTVQSPSSDDATVYSAAGGGSLVNGFDEPDWGFTLATELDALTVALDAPSPAPILTADAVYVSPNQDVQLTVRHATPAGSVFGLAGTARALLPTQRGGFGYAVFDPAGPTRPWPAAQGGHMTADAAGTAAATVRMPLLPPGSARLDLMLQAYDIFGRRLSTPVALRVM